MRQKHARTSFKAQVTFVCQSGEYPASTILASHSKTPAEHYWPPARARRHPTDDTYPAFKSALRAKPTSQRDKFSCPKRQGSLWRYQFLRESRRRVGGQFDGARRT